MDVAIYAISCKHFQVFIAVVFVSIPSVQEVELAKLEGLLKYGDVRYPA